MADPLDKVWKALADRTRRRILDLLREGPRRTTEIVEAFPRLSRFGVMKHLEVLKDCRLVVARKQGREVYNSINAAPLRQIYERWVRRYENLWADTLLRVKELAEEEPGERGASAPG
jgi:DNA-binding transcriptional ArsR family regulator